MDEFIIHNYDEENCIPGHVHWCAELLDVITVNSKTHLLGFTCPPLPFQAESVFFGFLMLYFVVYLE